MKKILSIITILIISLITIFSVNVYAASLTDINVTTTKTTVKSGENVTVDIEFGEELGAYTFEVDYDNTLFQYVSSEGGTASDNGSRVIVTFYDTTGGTNPRSNMSVTFKARNVTSQATTNFSVTANGLSNPDASVTYDDITTAIVKGIVVQPTGTNNTDNNTGNQGGTNQENTESPNENQNTTGNEPSTMPQTGNMVYMYTIPTILILTVSYILLRRKK